MRQPTAGRAPFARRAGCALGVVTLTTSLAWTRTGNAETPGPAPAIASESTTDPAARPAPPSTPAPAPAPPRAAPSRAPLGEERTPARLAIVAPEGAAIRVDGVFVGFAPLPGPVEVEPGARRVRATLGGSEPRTITATTKAGTTTTIAVELETTTARYAAWGLLGVSGAALGTAIACGAMAVVSDREVTSIDDRNGNRTPSPADAADRASAADTRDGLRLASGIGAGVGLAAFAAAGVLLVYGDGPADEPPRPAASRPRAPPFTFDGSIGPEGAGGRLRVRF